MRRQLIHFPPMTEGIEYELLFPPLAERRELAIQSRRQRPQSGSCIFPEFPMDFFKQRI